MENQTRFDLNTAIQNWQQELAAQPNLTVEMRRELESHVRDTMAELRRHGLNDDESFWLARRRMGQPKELAEEFAKADPATTLRKRVLWIAVALFVLCLWQNLMTGLWLALSAPNYWPWVSYVTGSLPFLAVAWLVVSVARGSALTNIVAWRSLIRSRGRFLFVACFSFLAVKGFTLAMALLRIPAQATRVWPWRNPFWFGLLSLLSNLVWPAVLIAVIVWLLPAAESRGSERAL